MQDENKLVATAVLSTTARAKVREARKEAKKHGGTGSGTGGGLGGGGIVKQSSLDGTEIPMERVTSHLSTASYLSMDTVSVLFVLQSVVRLGVVSFWH